MKSLNIKESNIFDLQITQTRHPKSVADGRTDSWTDILTGQTDRQTDGQSGPITRPAFPKVMQVNTVNKLKSCIS